MNPWKFVALILGILFAATWLSMAADNLTHAERTNALERRIKLLSVGCGH